jgi:signal transduction histidine kinase
VRLVLSNLLENALKYGPAGNLVQLRSEVRDGRVALEVEDRGPGIPLEELPRIFDKHYRGSAAAGGTRGSGLGLHVARTLALAMNGDLEVRSRTGEGTCFTLWLPAAGDASPDR